MVLLYLPPPQTSPRLSAGSTNLRERRNQKNKREAREVDDGKNIPQKVLARDWGRGSCYTSQLKLVFHGTRKNPPA